MVKPYRSGLALALLFSLIALLCTLAITDAEDAVNQTSRFSVEDLVAKAFSNPKYLISLVIQLGMGFGLGYVLAKMLKYILAFIAILVLGFVLSVWSLGETVEDVISSIIAQFYDVVPTVMGFLATLGILTIGPITVGFILGALVGLRK
ncbi:MAG: hypothetical protein DRO13_05680 [Thermoprotei archaeon]|nr:MAG: hypothetical protein DRO13_05680 [Thermoprotei archaeon]